MRTFFFVSMIIFSSNVFSQRNLVIGSLTNKEFSIDACFEYNDKVLYFIKGDNVARYNMDKNIVDGVLKLSENAFPGVTFRTIDAALNYGNGKIFFFSGIEYTRFDLKNFYADPGYPKLIKEGWPGLSKSGISASINWPGKSYFFVDNLYYRYDRNIDTVDVDYPKETNMQTWPGLTFPQIDDALNISGKTYFFYKDKYIRYDIKSDKADPGFPALISKDWHALQKALMPDFVPVENSANTIENKLQINKEVINLYPYTIDSDNELPFFTVLNDINSGLILGFQQNNDAVVCFIDKYNKITEKTFFIQKSVLSSMYKLPDGSLVVLVGKNEDELNQTSIPNTLYFLKYSSSGELIQNKRILGGGNSSSAKSIYSGQSKAKMVFNGTEFGIYFEVQKNDNEFDGNNKVSKGDMFFVTDIDGNVKIEKIQSWTASSSNTLQIANSPSGNFYTGTIGDSNPFGLQIFNRNTKSNFVAWPPKEDFLNFDQCKSANAVGTLSGIFVDQNFIYTFLGTLDHPNIGIDSKVDPLFLKMDFQGNILTKKWLTQTPEINEALISIFPIEQNFLVAFGSGVNSGSNSEQGSFEFCVIDKNGNFMRQIEKVNFPFGANSKLLQLSEKKFAWFEQSENGSDFINLYFFTLE